MTRTIKQSMPRKSCPSRTGEVNSSGLKSIVETTVVSPGESGERLLTIEQLAERLQYSAQWVRRFGVQNNLAYLVSAIALRYRAADLSTAPFPSSSTIASHHAP